MDFGDLSTPLIADACLRVSLPIRLAPPGLRSVMPGSRLAGRVLPVRHYGSVDVFLEAFEVATPGDVLVIDNGGRLDEACIGDLTALEARSAGVRGIVVWGGHRDTAELQEIGLPVFSYGTCLAGPQRLDPREPDALETAAFGPARVSRQDVVFADADGALFVPLEALEDVLAKAALIRATERRQAQNLTRGQTLRVQLRFAEFLDARAKDPGTSFRDHLRRIGGAIEE